MPMIDEVRRRAAALRNPARCFCQGGESGPSTHRAPAHLSRCRHSTLADDTGARGPRARLRPVLGSRRVIAVWDDDQDVAELPELMATAGAGRGFYPEEDEER